MNQKRIDTISIDSKATVLFTLKRMDEIHRRLLLVFEDGRFINIVSLGDLQRAIISNHSLDYPICKILRKNTQLADEKDSFEEIKQKMLTYRTECMPVLDQNKNLVDVYFWEDVFSGDEIIEKKCLSLPVVIMAGGEGTRLRPLTNVIPKPLIPIGKKTIVEEIMDKFIDKGCSSFFLSVNYKAETIRHYFDQLNTKYNIEYVKEDAPLGTAGSLYLLKRKIKSTFFVSNCDIIINDDYAEIYNYHKKNKNELTVVAALKHYPIPYGTIETKEDGILESLIEKPEITYKINSGMYILEPHLLDLIPENKFYHITQLIQDIVSRNGRVGVFPVSEGSWVDIGDWNQYLLNYSAHQ